MIVLKAKEFGGRRAKSFMQWLVDGDIDRRVDASKLAIVVAHPDDETIGCGGILAALRHVSVIVVTNGAPPDPEAARVHGFASARAYAAARSRELRAALALAGIAGPQIFELGVADGAVWRNIPDIRRQLVGVFVERGIETVVTHAFEGGHSDHDGVAVCAHQAAASLGRRRAAVVEMPLYHAGPAGAARQVFCDGDEGVSVALNDRMLRRKTAMFAAYRSQAETLADFAVAVERFRSARTCEFSLPPNGGRLAYDLSRIDPIAGDWSLRVRRAVAGEGASAQTIGARANS